MSAIDSNIDVPAGYELVHPKDVTEDCFAYERHRDAGENIFSIRLTEEQKANELWRTAHYSIQQHGGYLDRKITVEPVSIFKNHDIYFVQEK